MSVDVSYRNDVYLDRSTADTPQQVVTFVIPYWVDAAIQRNRLNYMSLKDIAALGQYVSLNDMAEVLALSGFEPASLLPEKAPLLYKLSRSGASRLWFDDGGYNRPIYKLSAMPSLQLDVLDRLTDEVYQVGDSPDMVEPALDTVHPVIDPKNEPEKELYKIVVVDHSTMVVVLQKGILNKLGDKEYSKGFLSAYLRALYSIESVNQVSKEPAFYEYVSRL